VGSRSSKLKKNTVTGAEVNEPTLGIVPNAKNAKKLGGLGPSAFLPVAGKAADADKLDGLDSKSFGLAGQPTRAQDANGVGNDAGCASDTLGIVVRDGRGDPIDGRFSVQVPGPTLAYGQIRADGSIRTSSANVTSVTHVTGTGVFCIHFSVVIGQAELEAAVAAPHEN
jgi:hypothetical protein